MAKNEKLSSGITWPIIFLLILAVCIIIIGVYKSTKKSVSTSCVELLNSDEYKSILNEEEKSKIEQSLLLYDSKDNDSIKIKENAECVLDKMNVDINVVDINNFDKSYDLSKYQTIVVCTNSLSFFDLDKISAYVKNGGGLFLTTALIADSDHISDYTDLLGIKKGSSLNFESIDSIRFCDDLLINGNGKTYDSKLINTIGIQAELNGDVKIHATTNDERKIPIMWDFKYENGYVFYCNAYLLGYENSRGILSAGYSRIHSSFIYPVINAAVMYIDDFPSPINNEYDERIYSQYGYNMKDFYYNVWWPKIKSLINKYGVKYTGLFIMTYEDDREPPYDNNIYEETFRYYAKELIASGGELGIHGYNHQPLALTGFNYGSEEGSYNTWDSMENIIESIKSVIKYAYTLTDGITINTYVAPSNIISKYVQSNMEKEISDIKVYAGLTNGEDCNMVTDFEVNENGIVYLPRVASGMIINEGSGEEYEIINQLSFNYVFSHFFHPDDVIDEERGAALGFETLFDGFDNLLNEITKTKIRYTTATEGAGALQRYYLTSCDMKYTQSGIEFNVNGLKDECYYMLKLNGKKIKNIYGADQETINEEYCLLKITSKDTVKIDLE